MCEVKGISERIVLLKLQIKKKTKISIIQIYAPTLDADQLEIDTVNSTKYYRMQRNGLQ